MKIALISFTTCSKHLNYGAVLHGYALQRYLARMGAESVVIDYVPRQLEGYSLKWPVLNARFLWRQPLLMVRYIVRWGFSTFANLRKLTKFRAFFSSRMSVTQRRYAERDLVGGALSDCGFDVFVCESDVIWKQRAKFPLDRGFFLAFPAADAARKVAYAPSLAAAPFDELEKEEVRTYLRTFAAVSCRERAGAEYLSALTGREVTWLVDPTLLLTAQDYAEIAVPPKERGYVLLYTCMKFNADMVREARRYAESLGKKLIEVGNYGIDRLVFGHKVVDDAGIEEWLGLFMNADAVVCNSFHGICFSVIFEKPFFVFSRGGGDLRFENICEALGLEGRLVPRDGKIPLSAPHIDFLDVRCRLESLRACAHEFISGAIFGCREDRS